jgi:hypothetical protein
MNILRMTTGGAYREAGGADRCQSFLSSVERTLPFTQRCVTQQHKCFLTVWIAKLYWAVNKYRFRLAGQRVCVLCMPGVRERRQLDARGRIQRP